MIMDHSNRDARRNYYMRHLHRKLKFLSECSTAEQSLIFRQEYRTPHNPLYAPQR